MVIEGDKHLVMARDSLEMGLRRRLGHVKGREAKEAEQSSWLVLGSASCPCSLVLAREPVRPREGGPLLDLSRKT